MSREWDDSYEGDIPYEFWQQAVKNAINGKRGQSALRELEAALVGMQNKRLIDGSLCEAGEVCALGALYMHQSPNRLRGWLKLQDLSGFAATGDGHFDRWNDDGNDLAAMGRFGEEHLGLRYSLAATIAEINDWEGTRESPEERYERVLAWVRRHIAVTNG